MCKTGLSRGDKASLSSHCLNGKIEIAKADIVQNLLSILQIRFDVPAER